MATLYSQMGSKVTLVSNRILPKVVPEASRMVQESLVKAGVDVKHGTKVMKVTRTGKVILVTLSNGETVQGTELLVATGRNARTAGMGLERVGAPSDGAWVEVDDSMTAMSVSGGWLYAVGDPNGRALLTHISKYQAKIAGDVIVAKANGTYQDEVAQSDWNKLTAKTSGLAIAQAIFTDPQVGAVGLTLEQAASKGFKARAVSTKMVGPGTFLHAEGYEGWAQWVIEEDTERLLGATFVGRDAIHQIHASTMAIVGKLTVAQLWHVIPPFPTMAEVYTSLSEAAEK
jgi:dihydrolipoamide dehydrogenase